LSGLQWHTVIFPDEPSLLNTLCRSQKTCSQKMTNM